MSRLMEIAQEMDHEESPGSHSEYGGGIVAGVDAGEDRDLDFEGFFRDHHDFVWRNLRRLGVRSDQLDDGLQDAFVTAHRQLSQLRPDASERAWLYTIVRRIAFRYRRTESRRRRKHDAFAEVDGTRNAEEVLERVDARRFLHRFLDGLGDKRGPVFTMIVLEGLSAPEVADALGLKLNTVYSRLRLARTAFDREVQRYRSGEEAAESLLRAGKGADDPPVGTAAAAWLLLDPTLISRTGTGLAWSVPAQLKIFAATVAIGTALVGGGALASAPAAASLGDVADREDVAAGAKVVLAKPVKRSETARYSLPAAEIVGEREPPSQQRAAQTRPSQPQTTAPRAPSPKVHTRSGSGGEPGSESGLAQEAALLKQAKSKLTSGDAGQALALLDSHERDFPKSKVSDLRDALRVSALCAAGRPREYRAHRALFSQRYPQSRFSSRVGGECDES